MSVRPSVLFGVLSGTEKLDEGFLSPQFSYSESCFIIRSQPHSLPPTQTIRVLNGRTGGLRAGAQFLVRLGSTADPGYIYCTTVPTCDKGPAVCAPPPSWSSLIFHPSIHRSTFAREDSQQPAKKEKNVKLAALHTATHTDTPEGNTEVAPKS